MLAFSIIDCHGRRHFHSDCDRGVRARQPASFGASATSTAVLRGRTGNLLARSALRGKCHPHSPKRSMARGSYRRHHAHMQQLRGQQQPQYHPATAAAVLGDRYRSVEHAYQNPEYFADRTLGVGWKFRLRRSYATARTYHRSGPRARGGFPCLFRFDAANLHIVFAANGRIVRESLWENEPAGAHARTACT
jgi:hypothetical protein